MKYSLALVNTTRSFITLLMAKVILKPTKRNGVWRLVRIRYVVCLIDKELGYVDRYINLRTVPGIKPKDRYSLLLDTIDILLVYFSLFFTNEIQTSEYYYVLFSIYFGSANY